MVNFCEAVLKCLVYVRISGYFSFNQEVESLKIPWHLILCGCTFDWKAFQICYFWKPFLQGIHKNLTQKITCMLRANMWKRQLVHGIINKTIDEIYEINITTRALIKPPTVAEKNFELRGIHNSLYQADLVGAWRANTKEVIRRQWAY